MSEKTIFESTLDKYFEQREKSEEAIVKEARYYIIRTLLDLDRLDFEWRNKAVYDCPNNTQGMTHAGLVDYLTGKVDERFRGADVLKGIKRLQKEGIVGESVVMTGEQENVYSKTVCYLLTKS